MSAAISHKSGDAPRRVLNIIRLSDGTELQRDRKRVLGEVRRLLVLGPNRPAEETRTMQDLLALLGDGRPLPLTAERAADAAFARIVARVRP